MNKNKNIAKVEKQENRKSVVKVVLAVFMSEFYLHVYTFAVFYCGEIYIKNFSTLTILKRSGQWQYFHSVVQPLPLPYSRTFPITPGGNSTLTTSSVPTSPSHGIH